MEDKIQFFGEVDKNKNQPDKGFGGEYPGWYFDGPRGQLATLKEEIRGLEKQNEIGAITKAQMLENEGEIEEKQKKYDTIVKSRPKLSGVNKDKVAGWCDELGEKIADAMYTYKAENRGTASPQDEANRMTYPCVDVPKELAKVCGIQDIPAGGGPIRVTRTQAEKMWKISRKALGEQSNVETLRKEG